MKLPTRILHSLALAIASVGFTGCCQRTCAPANPTPPSSSSESNNPTGEQCNPADPDRCEPAACPACGRG